MRLNDLVHLGTRFCIVGFCSSRRNDFATRGGDNEIAWLELGQRPMDKADSDGSFADGRGDALHVT